MSWGLGSEKMVPAQAGLRCRNAGFAETIARAVSSVMVLEPRLDVPASKCDLPLLIVAELALAPLCASVARERSEGYAGSLLAVSEDTQPSAVEKVVAAGANDYVALPDRIAELPYRAMALLRHSSGFWPRKVADQPNTELRLDANLRTASVGTQRVLLTMLEFLILQYLQARPAIWVSASELLSEVCGCSAQGDTTRVRVHMASLRKKLGEHRDRVESRRTYGYRWVAQTDVIEPMGFTQT